MSDRLQPSCKRCRYWDPHTFDEETGWCVRNPPVAFTDDAGIRSCLFPATSADQRCGEFRTAFIGVGYPSLWETKSVGAKTYREIAKHGLKKSRPGYYAQVAVYMAYLDLTEHPCIFTVTNLDSGEQLHLLIPFDAEEAQRMSDRAVRIIKAAEAGELLPRPFPDADFYECKFCGFADRCWSLPS